MGIALITNNILSDSGTAIAGLVPTSRTISTTAPLTGGGDLSADRTIAIPAATSAVNGYLTSADWTTFNAKQAAGDYITSLTGEATGTGPGATAVTLNNASVTGKVLTGVNITGGTVLATDTMLTAFGKLQNQINGLIGSTIYQGVWNASTNTPTLASGTGTRGYYYIVNVAGNTNLDGITDWQIGDWAIYDGTAWQKVDNTESVTSVNGFTGAVSLTTDNIAEGTTNLYFSNARARSAVSLTTTGSSGAATYNNTTGVFNIPNYGAALADYVTLGTEQTITARKTFSDVVTNSVIYIKSGTPNGMYLQSYTSGYLEVGATNAGTTYYSNLVFPFAARTYTLPNASGTIALTSDIPSGGITGTLTATKIPKATGANTIADSIITDSGTYITVSAAAVDNYIASFINTDAGSSGIYVKADGAAFVCEPLSLVGGITLNASGSASFSGDITANKFIKSGGTSAQYLMADGSVTTGPSLAGYVPYTGATANVNLGTYGLTANSITDGYITISVAQINRDPGFVEMQYTGTGGVKFFGNTAYPITFTSGTGAATFSSSITATTAYFGLVGDLLFTKSNGTSYSRFLYSGANTNVVFSGGTTANNGAFGINNYENDFRLVNVLNNGNFLIGTTTDSGYKLDVIGTGRFSGNTTIGIATAATNVKLIFNGVASKAAGIEFQQSGTPQWYIGNGIASEDNNFELYNSNGTMAMKIIKSTNAIAFQGATTFSSSVQAVSYVATGLLTAGLIAANTSFLDQTSSGTARWLSYGSNSSTRGAFSLYQASSANTLGQSVLDISSTGASTFSSSVTTQGELNVGFGILSSDRMMQVSGTAFTSGTSQFGAVFNPTFGNTITNLYGIYISLSSGTSVTNRYALFIDGPNSGTATNDYSIYSGNAAKSYFAGKVGIGVTSSNALLDISGGQYNTGLIVRSPSTNGAGIGILNSDTGGHNWYIISTASSNGGGAGNLGFYDDTAGNYHMYIKGSSGNVLIGTTTDSGYKLDVNGTVAFGLVGNVIFTKSNGSSYSRFLYSGSYANVVFTGGATANSGCFGVNNYEDSVRLFNISNSGAATFSSSVQASSFTDGYIVWSSAQINRSGGFVELQYTSGGGVKLFGGGATPITFNTTGSGTFSSSVTATAFFESSDKNIKTLIEDNYQTKGIESVVAKLYTKNGKEELGYFAQDVQGILPSAVIKGTDGLLSLSYREVHTAKIARLEKRVAELEEQLNLK